MAGVCEARLAKLGLVLPAAPAPAASYVPFTRSGSLLFVSGQLPMQDGKLAFVGKIGAELTLEQGQAAAKLCAVNILAQIKAAAGDLDRVAQVLRLVGYVASAPDFTDQHKIVNGASELIAAIFDEAGRHARTSVGVPALPLNAAVEVEATVELKA